MNKKSTRYCRRQNGFALIAIIGFGAIALAVLFAMFPQIINAMRSEGGARSMSELRTAASTGIDYAIQQLNDNAMLPAGSISPIDLTLSTVPSKYLPNFSDGQVKVRIKQIDSSNFGDYSSIFSPRLDTNNYTATNNWRVVESTATRGGISRSIRVFLEPRYERPGDEHDQPDGTSFFKSALAANSKFNFDSTQGGTLEIGSPSTSTTKPILQSNGDSVLGSSLTLLGGLKITSETSPTISIGSHINGQVVADSNTDLNSLGFKANGVATDTVVPPGGTPPFDQSATTIDAVTSAPTPSSGTTSPLPKPSDFASIESGSYTSTSVDFASPGNTATIGGPVKIYIQDGSTAQVTNPEIAASIKASALVNNPTEGLDGTAAAQNFQIWYSGSRPINIDLGENGTFKGLIYAPNAPITVTGRGILKGALVGNDVTVTPSGATKFVIDTNLQDANNSQTKASGLTYLTSASTNQILIHGYKAVTWQEIRGDLAH